MKPGGGKRKGNQWENYVKMAIQNAIGQEVILCRKTFGSGSQPDDKGDIIVGNHMIECKWHKKFTLGEIGDYWTKVSQEAKDSGKIPVLIMKANRVDPIVMMNDHDDMPFIEFLRLLKRRYKND